MAFNSLIIKGMSENNLHNIDLEIPKNKITVFTGVSGSGKSSIVFDTIAHEASRQLNQSYSTFIQTFLPKYSKPDVLSILKLESSNDSGSKTNGWKFTLNTGDNLRYR